MALVNNDAGGTALLASVPVVRLMPREDFDRRYGHVDKLFHHMQSVGDLMFEERHVLHFMANQIMQEFFNRGTWPMALTVRHFERHYRILEFVGLPHSAWNRPPSGILACIERALQLPVPQAREEYFVPAAGEL